MTAFYNEWEKYPAQWLRNLSEANLIAPGVVDERSVTALAPADVRGATQAHFFAGIGVWSYALRLAGWPDDFPIWSASLPCQPFSQAGQGKGVDDERHLWPDFFKLLRECRPQCIIGEQSASPDGIEWLDAVQADLKSIGYSCGHAVLASAWVGAPHIRHRVYWVAHTKEFRWPAGWNGRPRDERDAAWLEFERHGDARRLADAYRVAYPEALVRCGGEGDAAAPSGWVRAESRPPRVGADDELADTDGERRKGQRVHLWSGQQRRGVPEAPGSSEAGELAHTLRAGRPERGPQSGGRSSAGSSSADGVGNATGVGRGQDRLHAAEGGGAGREREAVEHRDAGAADALADGGLGDTGRERGGWDAGAVHRAQAAGERRGHADGDLGHEPVDASEARELGDTGSEGLPQQQRERGVAAAAAGGGDAGEASLRAGSPLGGFWTDALWLYCRDGKFRPTEPGVEPLASGVTGRVGQIKAYGNAITSLVAATFIRAFIEATQHLEHEA